MTKRTSRHLLFLAGSVVLAGSALVLPQGAAYADDNAATEVRPERAEREAERAERELARGRTDRAVRFAEAAVEWDPQNASHRSTLGQAYMAAGRFVAAEESFADARHLGDTSTRSIIGHALSLIASNQASAAVELLDANRETLPATDYGLGLALAGDSNRGGMILMDIARSEGATARDRQNLALAFALGGRWMEAQLIAAQDLGAQRAQQRIQQWAGMVQSGDPRLRIAGVIGATPVEDPGMPVRLALGDAPARTALSATSVADPAPIAMYAPPPPEAAPAAEYASAMPVEVQEVAQPVSVAAAPVEAPVQMAAVAEPAPAPVMTAAAAPAPVQQASAGTAAADSVEQAMAALDVPVESTVSDTVLRFVSIPVIQPLRNAVSAVMSSLSTEAPAQPARVAAASAGTRRGSAAQGWAVQLGAFNSVAVARQRWDRLQGRSQSLAQADAISTTARIRGRTYQRLLATGFDSRAEATAACASLARSGNACFVRRLDGSDRVVWASRSGGERIAAASQASAARRLARR